MNRNTTSLEVQIREGKTHTTDHLELIREEPLSIRVQGKTCGLVMRTPGDEKAHAAGFCLAEGILDDIDDLVDISLGGEEAPNLVNVTVTPDRMTAIGELLDRRGTAGHAAQGTSGRELIEDFSRIARAVSDGPAIDLEKAYHYLDKLWAHQELHRRTRASHAAAIYSANLELLSVAEDVGRHNALDKAVGMAFLKGELYRAGVLILSSRISYEMVQKAARAGIPFILSGSRPTALGVELADSLNMTLASRSRDSGVFVFCRPGRLAGPHD